MRRVLLLDPKYLGEELERHRQSQERRAGEQQPEVAIGKWAKGRSALKEPLHRQILRHRGAGESCGRSHAGPGACRHDSVGCPYSLAAPPYAPMDFVRAAILGIVQGLTEFLPISSSGHLILVPALFKWPDQGLSFDVGLHVGTLLALLIYFWRDWLRMIRSGLLDLKEHGLAMRQYAEESQLLWLLALGSVPAAVAVSCSTTGSKRMCARRGSSR